MSDYLEILIVALAASALIDATWILTLMLAALPPKILLGRDRG